MIVWHDMEYNKKQSRPAARKPTGGQVGKHQTIQAEFIDDGHWLCSGGCRDSRLHLWEGGSLFW